MGGRWFVSAALACALFIAASVPRAFAAAPAAHAQNYTFAFHDADISQVAEEILGSSLGLNYSVDPSITGKMSFRIDRRLTDAQLLDAFQASLAASDIVLVRQGDSVTLTPRAKAKGMAPLRSTSEGFHGAGYETVAVPLAYASPSEVAKALQAVSSNDPVVFVDDKQGLLILGGVGPELEAAVQLVHTFDHSGLEDSKIRFFELTQAPADTVSSDLEHVLQASGVFGVTVVPLKRMNGLFVFARTSAAIDEVGRWIEKLDVPSKETANALWVYHPRNAAAEALAGTLGGLISSQSPSGAQGPVGDIPAPQRSSFNQSSISLGSSGGGLSGGFGGGGLGGGFSQTTTTTQQSAASTGQAASITGTLGDDTIRVSVDRASNTLLILAPPSRWLQISKMLDEIDHAPNQVLIEASILEVTLTNQFSFGIDWSVVGDHGHIGASSINNSAGTVSAATPGLSVTYLDHGIQAALNTLAGKTAVEVLSAPKIIALDNKPAKLEVGDQVPIVTQSAQNTVGSGSPVINSVDYRDTGVILDVTPRITGDNRIFLDIDQEVSSVGTTTSSTINSPTIQQRALQTQLILTDGGTVALGGLISNEHDIGDTGTPYLMNIPVLGSLFKTSSRKTNRTELIVLISAKIIRDQSASDRALTDLLADMHEIESRGLLKPKNH